MGKSLLFISGILSAVSAFSMEDLWENKEKKEWKFVEDVVRWTKKLPKEIQQIIGEYVIHEEWEKIKQVRDKYYELTKSDGYKVIGQDCSDQKAFIEVAAISPSHEWMAICLKVDEDDEEGEFDGPEMQKIQLHGVHLPTGRRIEPMLSDTEKSDSIIIHEKEKSDDKEAVSVQELQFNDQSDILKLVLKEGAKRKRPRYFNAYSFYELPEDPELEDSEFSHVIEQNDIISNGGADQKVLRKNRFYVEKNSDGEIRLYDSKRYTIIKEYFEKPKICSLACALYHTMRLSDEHLCHEKLKDHSFLYRMYKKSMGEPMFKKLCSVFDKTIWSSTYGLFS